MKKPKINKAYVVQALIDFGPPTVLSVFWALYMASQNEEDLFWTVFGKNFVPAFVVLNWLSIRISRTKNLADKKSKSKVVGAKIEELKQQMDRIEKLLIENKSIKNKED